MLRQLALRWLDPWETALVEQPPASGFLGDAGAVDAACGSVTFARDDPEAIAIDVEGPAGRSRVGFRYDPPGLRLGVLVSALAIGAALGVLWLTRPRRAERPAPGGSTP